MKVTDQTSISVRPARAAELLGISRAELYVLLAHGIIPSRKLGRATLILVADLEAFVRSLPCGEGKSA